MISFFRFTLLVLASVGASLFAAQFAMAQDGDAERGARIFRQRCAGCHINQGASGRGPNLTDIVDGQPAVPGFQYSSSIRFASWAWTIRQLDDYLRNPGAVVPGATMASQVADKQDRVDLIAYLKTLRSPEGTPPARGRVKSGL